MASAADAGPPAATGATAENLRRDVVILAERIGERNLFRYSALREADEHLAARLAEEGYTVRRQEYEAGGKRVANIEVELAGKGAPDEIVVVGAHYDSIAGSPGADDNAIGVAALLELARLFRRGEHRRTLRFVFFVNEEPPYFNGPLMGSRVYARRCRERKENIVGMLSLETIGWYSDAPGSQVYPFPNPGLYPDTGNFIGFVSNLGSSSLFRRVLRTFRRESRFPAEGVVAPSFVTGIDWSDHASFWREGYPALMVTDTAPFRYPWYHSRDDTAERLDYRRMAQVVEGLAAVVADLAGVRR